MKFFLAFLAALLAATVQAQPGDKFRSLDRNGDGFLSREEAIHDRRQVGNYVTDSVLTAKVKTALLRERGIRSTDVHVETSQGRALLSGFVDTEEQKSRALRVASRVEGVREVRDGLNVR